MTVFKLGFAGTKHTCFCAVVGYFFNGSRYSLPTIIRI